MSDNQHIPFVAWHPVFRLKLPEKHRFPMAKYGLLHERLLKENILTEEDFIIPDKIDTRYLDGVHDKEYYERFIHLEFSRQEERRSGFPQTPELVDRELRLAWGTVLATLAAQKTGIGFSTAGGTHHAGSNFAEGFCMLNDQAIAANYLLNYTDIKKVLIIDLDVHQGNGTAEIFQNNPDVFTFSMHGAKNYPFKKEKSDLDVGVDDGISGKEYLPLLEAALSQIKREFEPDFIFYQAGVDVLETDRLGRLKLSKRECAERDRMVFEFCKSLKVPVQVSMGGGYSHEISDIVDAHLQTYRLGISILKND